MEKMLITVETKIVSRWVALIHLQLTPPGVLVVKMFLALRPLSPAGLLGIDAGIRLIVFYVILIPFEIQRTLF